MKIKNKHLLIFFPFLLVFSFLFTGCGEQAPIILGDSTINIQLEEEKDVQYTIDKIGQDVTDFSWMVNNDAPTWVNIVESTGLMHINGSILNNISQCNSYKFEVQFKSTVGQSVKISKLSVCINVRPLPVESIIISGTQDVDPRNTNAPATYYATTYPLNETSTIINWTITRGSVPCDITGEIDEHTGYYLIKCTNYTGGNDDEYSIELKAQSDSTPAVFQTMIITLKCEFSQPDHIVYTTLTPITVTSHIAGSEDIKAMANPIAYDASGTTNPKQDFHYTISGYDYNPDEVTIDSGTGMLTWTDLISGKLGDKDHYNLDLTIAAVDDQSVYVSLTINILIVYDDPTSVEIHENGIFFEVADQGTKYDHFSALVQPYSARQMVDWTLLVDQTTPLPNPTVSYIRADSEHGIINWLIVDPSHNPIIPKVNIRAIAFNVDGTESQSVFDDMQTDFYFYSAGREAFAISDVANNKLCAPLTYNIGNISLQGMIGSSAPFNLGGDWGQHLNYIGDNVPGGITTFKVHYLNNAIDPTRINKYEWYFTDNLGNNVTPISTSGSSCSSTMECINDYSTRHNNADPRNDIGQCVYKNVDESGLTSAQKNDRLEFKVEWDTTSLYAQNEATVTIKNVQCYTWIWYYYIYQGSKSNLLSDYTPCGGFNSRPKLHCKITYDGTQNQDFSYNFDCCQTAYNSLFDGPTHMCTEYSNVTFEVQDESPWWSDKIVVRYILMPPGNISASNWAAGYEDIANYAGWTVSDERASWPKKLAYTWKYDDSLRLYNRNDSHYANWKCGRAQWSTNTLVYLESDQTTAGLGNDRTQSAQTWVNPFYTLWNN